MATKEINVNLWPFRIYKTPDVLTTSDVLTVYYPYAV